MLSNRLFSFKLILWYSLIDCSHSNKQKVEKAKYIRIQYKDVNAANHLYRFKDRGFLEVLGNLGTLVFDRGFTVHFNQLAEIELGSLEDLDLSDIDVLDGVDIVAGLFDGLANHFRGELLDKFLHVARGSFLGHDFKHLLANLLDLSSLSIGSLADLVRAALGEGNGEETEEVSIGGLDIDVGFNNGLPFLIIMRNWLQKKRS